MVCSRLHGRGDPSENMYSSSFSVDFPTDFNQYAKRQEWSSPGRSRHPVISQRFSYRNHLSKFSQRLFVSGRFDSHSLDSSIGVTVTTFVKRLEQPWTQYAWRDFIWQRAVQCEYHPKISRWKSRPAQGSELPGSRDCSSICNGTTRFYGKDNL
jgi:hypothetical protein